MTSRTRPKINWPKPFRNWTTPWCMPTRRTGRAWSAAELQPEFGLGHHSQATERLHSAVGELRPRQVREIDAEQPGRVGTALVVAEPQRAAVRKLGSVARAERSGIGVR